MQGIALMLHCGARAGQNHCHHDTGRAECGVWCGVPG